MSAKIYDFKTERFIDNLTSITPKALKGGLIAVASHPKLEEVLVGGADGAPQLYRLQRIAKRVIGDNSNLVREYPAMKGRIFAVDYSPDGKRIAAGSSLDGKGYLRVFNSDVKREVSDELKKAFGERVASRKAAEEKLVQEYQTEGTALLASAEYDAGVYALTFSPDGRTLAVSGADGVLRLLDSGSLRLKKAFVPVPLPDDMAAKLVGVSVSPALIEVSKRYDYGQVLVRGWLASGDYVDLTREAKYSASSDIVTVSERGLVKPTKSGEGSVSVSVRGYRDDVSVVAKGLEKAYKPDYVRDVMPVISKLGCNLGTCHGAKDGKNGFKLSLRGYDPVFDVRAFADDLAGRRVNFAQADDSLMLLKATSAVPHQGGGRTTPGSDYYNIVRDWIATGCELNLKSARVKSIELLPENPVVQDIGGSQQVRVIATYSNGEKRDVTAEAFVESGNQDIVKTDSQGLVTTLRRGEAALLARFEGAYAATTLTVMGDRSGFIWSEPESWTEIDRLVAAKWKRMKILPSGLCDDAEFIRRIHLDLTGLPPTSDDVRAFLADKRPSREKRDAVIDSLLGNEDYVDHWANKWADLLQVNRKFLGAEGARIFRDWIRKQVKDNLPYDQFVQTILTAKGSNKENPPASYFKILRTSEELMENTTHLFLATRFNCNKCHDHPFERWTQNQYYETAAFFAQVGLKRDPKFPKENLGGTAVEGAKPLYEIVEDLATGDVKHERTGLVTAPEFPYSATARTEKDASRREQLAAWLTSPDNEYFARSYANRIWGYLTGVGVIEPLDDIRAGNPASNPELLDFLTREFVKNDFDVRKLMRLIVRSRTYQLEIGTHKWNEDDNVNYSHAIVRRLPAEVLYDTIHRSLGSVPKIPGVSAGTRAGQLPDAGIRLADGFFAKMGRPPRESSCECERINDVQLGPVMAMISGATVGDAISDPNNAIADLVAKEKDEGKLINEIFLRVLNRPAKPAEIAATRKTIAGIAKEDATIRAELVAYEKKLAPIMEKRKQQRAEELAQARKELADYSKSIAAREKQRAEEREKRIASADKVLKESEAKLGERQLEWEKSQKLDLDWKPVRVTKASANAGVKLTINKDGSVTSSEKGDRSTYTLTASTDLKYITAIRLEAMEDKAMPRGGPGWHSDGNFVLTEFTVKGREMGSKAAMASVELEKAVADFEQSGFTIGKAIDGKQDRNGGWAVSPQGGSSHWATFQLKKALKNGKGTEFSIELAHLYTQNKPFRLGRFRISVIGSDKPTGLSLPEDLLAVVKTPREKRDKVQAKSLAERYRLLDESLIKLTRSLADAKKALEPDKRLVEMEAVVKRFEAPLPPDPEQSRLQRAAKLSEEQLKQARLMGMQDLAWALVNSPAFLFNH
ncbi:MAG: DUF1549 domain-containing protein [Verrucomicrobiae bacterium]|nr:DUF1549 domain-containing protein [Verrucomicrobiae bacterium]